MGNTVKDYDIKYTKAKEMYLNGQSLTSISKELHMDRGTLSKHFKAEGIEVINKQNITKFNENYFDIIDNEHKAYWLGFLYADGAISKDSNGIEISLKSSDINHLQKFVKDLDFKIEKHIFQNETRCRVEIANKHMKESLIKLGCTPQKSLTIEFPTQDQVPTKFLYDFLRGYIDGDGSIMIGVNHKGIYDKPRLSVLGTKNFLQGIIDNTGWKQVKIQFPSKVYCIEWGGYYCMPYLDQLYKNATIYLDRKYKKYLTLSELNKCRSSLKKEEL